MSRNKARLAYNLITVRVRTGREPPAQLCACRQRRPIYAGQAHPLLPSRGARFRGHRTDFDRDSGDRQDQEAAVAASRADCCEGTREDAGRRRRAATGNQIVIGFVQGRRETRRRDPRVSWSNDRLYLFLTVEDYKVQRTFIPAHAYADYSIASPSARCFPRSRRIRWTFLKVGLHLQQHLRSQRIGGLSTASQIISGVLEQVLKTGTRPTRKTSSAKSCCGRRSHQQRGTRQSGQPAAAATAASTRRDSGLKWA